MRTHTYLTWVLTEIYNYMEKGLEGSYITLTRMIIPGVGLGLGLKWDLCNILLFFFFLRLVGS